MRILAARRGRATGAGRALPLALLALAAAGCVHGGVRREPVEADADRARVEVGLASYYAQKLQGRRTASGSRYDAEALTAAHRTAPFGTRLRVTDLESGRSVVVRVDDRGPWVKGRVVDLSYAAARALGMIERGVMRVRVERVE